MYFSFNYCCGSFNVRHSQGTTFEANCKRVLINKRMIQDEKNEIKMKIKMKTKMEMTMQRIKGIVNETEKKLMQRNKKGRGESNKRKVK